MTIQSIRTGALLVALASGASIAGAQERTGILGVTFASANVNEDGYIHGNLIVEYAFRICSGTVRLSYGVRPGSVEGSTTYWYKGHNYGVPAGTQPPNAPFLVAETRVHFGAQEVYRAEKRDPSVTTDVSCGGPQWIGLGSVSKYDKDAKTPRELQDVLNRFTFDIGITRNPLRSPSVESAFAREMAAAAQKARRDSLDRITAARRDSIQAAQAAQAARPVRQTGAVAGTSPGTNTRTGTGASIGTSTSPNGQRGTVRETRPADAETQARDAAAERQRQAAAVQRMLAERQAEDEARTATINEATSQLAGMVSGILEERRRDAERREAAEAEAARLKERYQLRKRAEYLAAPERPRCTDADVRESLALDQPTTGVLSLQTCRLADSTSAVLYELVLDRPRAVTVTLDQSGFYGIVRLELPGTVLATGNRATPIEQKLPAGRYRVVVTSEALGETGGYTVTAQRSVLSKIPGLSYGFVAGYTATPFPGESAQQEGGLRLGLGLGSHLMLLVQGGTGGNDDGVDQTFVQYGARGYFKNPYTEWRPFVQALMGTHKYDLWRSISIDHYQGNGMSFGGGVEWFLARRWGAELALYQSTGTISLPGSSSSVSIGGTHVQMGLTFHQ